MQESDLNSLIVSHFKDLGYHTHKLPDPQGMEVMTAAKRPYDGFLVFEDFCVHFESKLIKNNLQAFAKNCVEDHQFENLLTIKRTSHVALPVITMGFWVPRKEYLLLVIDPEFFFNMPQKSILKKQLQWYIDHDYSISLKTKDLPQFTPELFKKKLISFLPDITKGDK